MTQLQDVKPFLVFAAVLEHGSMNAAAEALGMTPSAVSQHISRLEAMHQLKLLHRSTRRLMPTDAGQALGAYCRRLRQTLLDTQATLQNLKTEAVGELHLALASGMADAPAFQTSLQQLAEHYPGVEPVLHFGDELTDLQQGRIDIAIRGGGRALDAPDLVARPLVTWPWQICASPDYLAAHPPITEPAQLLQHRWMNDRPLPIRVRLQRGDEEYLLEVPKGLRCHQLMAARALTLGGMGLSMQLSGEIDGWVARGRLQIVLPEWRLPEVALYAVTPHRAQSARVRAGLAVLQRCFQAGSGVSGAYGDPPSLSGP